jgi:hypothetical protein
MKETIRNEQSTEILNQNFVMSIEHDKMIKIYGILVNNLGGGECLKHHKTHLWATTVSH